MICHSLRHSVWLDDQEEDDQPAEQHELEVLCGDSLKSKATDHDVGEQDRHQDDKGGAEKRPEHASQTTDDDHEQHLERNIDVERLGGFDTAEPE